MFQRVDVCRSRVSRGGGRWQGIVAAVAVVLCWARASHAQVSSPTIRITPNAIQDPDKSMEVVVAGEVGQILHLTVLLDCSGNRNIPDLAPTSGQGGQGSCQSVWRGTIKVGQRRVGKATYRLSEIIPKEFHEQRLWLRVSDRAGGHGTHGDAVFTVIGKPCTVWKTLVDWFSDNGCPAEVGDAIRLDRSRSGALPKVLFEVRRIIRAGASGAWGKAVSVPGTRAATGVAWDGPNHLLVTIGRIDTTSVIVPDDAPEPAAPGLYRIALTDGAATPLVRARKGERLSAPFPVGDDCVAFLREHAGSSEEHGIDADLMIWRDGKVIREIPLRQSLHQILAVNVKQGRILAYSRWRGIPSLVSINFHTRSITQLGFPAELYHAVMRAPGGGHAVLAFEDASGQTGWDMALFDDKGEWVEDIEVGDREDLMPSWRPIGTELVYLGQVD